MNMDIIMVGIELATGKRSILKVDSGVILSGKVDRVVSIERERPVYLTKEIVADGILQQRWEYSDGTEVASEVELEAHRQVLLPMSQW